jgi:hypothetical protein
VTANNATICLGESINLNTLITNADGGTITFHASQADANNNANPIAQPVTPAGAGDYIYYVRSTNGNCFGTTTLTVTVNACGANCTYTQGYFGNKNGNSCDADGTDGTPITYNSPVELMTQLLSSPIVVGVAPKSITIPAGAAAAVKLNSVMPGGGKATELKNAVNCSIMDACFNTYLSNQGRINNVLLSQTITLSLNMRISSSLSSFELEAGTFATAKPEGGCGSTIPMQRICNYNPVWPYELLSVTNEYVYKTISQAVIDALNTKGYDNTVAGLLQLANDALANVDGTVGTEGGATLSDINNAVSAINEGFDQCRIFIGWDVEECAPNDPAQANLIVSGARINTNTEVDQTAALVKINAFPNPFSDRVRFNIQSNVSGKASLVVYNMVGQKIGNVFEGYVVAGRGQVVEYKAPLAARTNLIYIFTINGKQRVGKLINQRY